MRTLTDTEKIERFMDELGSRIRVPARIYLTGGATAVLHGWRESTVDIDLKFVPEHDALFRELPLLKEKLEINIELAAPSDFIPELPGWEDRSIYIGTKGKLHFYHYDPYSQALSKIERGHSQDLKDVESMFDQKLITAERLSGYFDQINPHLYRYPAIDPNSFEANVRKVVKQFS